MTMNAPSMGNFATSFHEFFGNSNLEDASQTDKFLVQEGV